jgi:membrane protein
MFAIAMLFLALLYWLTGPKGLARPPVLIGAFLSSLLLTLGVTLFSALITFSSRYSLVYGSLASMIILMVWLYFCGNIVIFGNVFKFYFFAGHEDLVQLLPVLRCLCRNGNGDVYRPDTDL